MKELADLEVQEFDIKLTADSILRQNIIEILKYGSFDGWGDVRTKWPDGTPATTIYITAICNKFNISIGDIPLTTLRPVAWKSAIKEILWIYQDQTNDVNLLRSKYGVKYWDSWMNEEGNLGKAYGYQIAKTVNYPEGKFNQIDRVLTLLKDNPLNRRIITNMIDMEEMKDMTLVPCAFMTMWTTRSGYLDMTLIQRSNDLVAAQSINAFQYAMLLIMVANHVGLKPGVFTHFIQNMHIYDRHLTIAREMYSRESGKTGKLIVKKRDNFYDYTIDDFSIEGYEPKPQISPIEIAV